MTKITEMINSVSDYVKFVSDFKKKNENIGNTTLLYKIWSAY